MKVAPDFYKELPPSGPALRIRSEKLLTNEAPPETLRILTFNVLNLKIHLGGENRRDLSTGELKAFIPRYEKPAENIQEVADVINEAHPHLAILQEIEGRNSLQEFVDTYLKEDYRIVYIQGNDSRIDIGAIVRKDFPFDLIVHSHREIEGTYKGQTRRLFSRDLLTYYLVPAGAPPEATPLLAILGLHNKSQRTTHETDPGSTILRAKQVEATLTVAKKIQTRFSDQVPVLIGGDFNNDIREIAPFNKKEEFSPLYENGFQLTSDLSATAQNPEDRFTHVYLPEPGVVSLSQIDGFFVQDAFAQSGFLVTTEIIRYKDKNGVTKGVPYSHELRNQNASDHYPVLLTVKLPAPRKN